MLYARRPSAASMALLGLTAADYDPIAPVHVWPENWPIVRIMQAMDRRWNVVAGAKTLISISLDLSALPVVLKALDITLDTDGFELLRHAETVALTHLN